ncbi:KOW domain-containing RNA-binding protein [uncultured Clostridium sp.]|uniref:KOW domain-containing RNA-binding protein n=1 Tax=uncultured Clostridium sp. TaxID=59620 RepID=UPI00262CFF7D|nr:KOW domain-containing RNA-binding protein [uncultured Clostridium sp.]
MQNNDLIGKVVLSLSGRDKDHLYVVVDSDKAKNLLLVNGDNKTISNPKKKNIKHLSFIDDIDDELKTTIMDKKRNADLRIKRFLKLRYIVKEG